MHWLIVHHSSKLTSGINLQPQKVTDKTAAAINAKRFFFGTLTFWEIGDLWEFEKNKNKKPFKQNEGCLNESNRTDDVPWNSTAIRDPPHCKLTLWWVSLWKSKGFVSSQPASKSRSVVVVNVEEFSIGWCFVEFSSQQMKRVSDFLDKFASQHANELFTPPIQRLVKIFVYARWRMLLDGEGIVTIRHYQKLYSSLFSALSMQDVGFFALPHFVAAWKCIFLSHVEQPKRIDTAKILSWKQRLSSAEICDIGAVHNFPSHSMKWIGPPT